MHASPVAGAPGVESSQDGLATYAHGSRAQPQRAGDVVGVGFLEQHRHDGPVGVIHAIQQLEYLIGLQVGKQLLAGGNARDDLGELLGISVTAGTPSASAITAVQIIRQSAAP